MDEGEVEELPYQVTGTTNPQSSKHGHQSLKHVCTKASRQLFNLERILAAKKRYSAESLISIFRHDGSYVALPYPPPLSLLRLDREVRHTIEILEKQRELEISRLQGSVLPLRIQDKPSPSTSCFNVGLIYHKLYLGFLARRLLKRTPTIFNRYTFVITREDAVIEEDSPDVEWTAKTRIERAHRHLRASGIEIAHTARKWHSVQPRYACFQPSLLRWSWTVVEDVAGETFPDAEE